MTHSEFWQVLESVFPGGLGDSLVQDLVLPELESRTGAQALRDGVPPLVVWTAIVGQMDLPPEYTYLHRKLAKSKSSHAAK